MADIVTQVQVLDNETLQPLWVGSDLMQVSVNESKKITRFQVEDGTEKNDHIIENAIEIVLRVVMVGEIVQLFEALRQTYRENDLVTIQTKVAVYADMAVEEIPHEEEAGMSDGITLEIRLVQWREVTPEYGELSPNDVAEPKQADTAKRGSQATTETPPAKKQSVLRSMF